MWQGLLFSTYLQSMEQGLLKKGLKLSLQVLIQFGCLSFTTWQTFSCLKKFVESPQASEIHLVDKLKAPAPRFAICPFDPKDGLNLTHLQECGIEYEDYYSKGIFSSLQCPDSKLLAQSIVLNSQEILSNITARNSFTDDLNHLMQICDLERIDDPSNCYLLNLSQSNLDIDDIDIAFRLQNIDVHVYTDGTFFDSFSYEEIDLKSKEKDVTLVYDVVRSLNTQEHPCEADETYKKDLCVWNEIHQTSLEKFGCTTPFGPKKTDICVDNTLGQSAIELMKHLRIPANNRCLDPCTTVAPQLSVIGSQDVVPDHDRMSSLSIKLPLKIKVISSYFSYKVLSLIAEIGGYVGLFLGVSVLDLKTVVDFVIKN